MKQLSLKVQPLAFGITNARVGLSPIKRFTLCYSNPAIPTVRENLCVISFSSAKALRREGPVGAVTKNPACHGLLRLIPARKRFMSRSQIPEFFDPETRRVIELALEDAWQELKNEELADSQSVRVRLATTIVALAAVGETDSRKLKNFALDAARAIYRPKKSGSNFVHDH